LRDERVSPIPKESVFHFEGGLKAFVGYLNQHSKPIHEPIYDRRQVEIVRPGGKVRSLEVEYAFQYYDTAENVEFSYANTIRTPRGGTHVTALHLAITKAINRVARNRDLLKSHAPNLRGKQTRAGLTAIISVRYASIELDSQNNPKLHNPEIHHAVYRCVADAFTTFAEKHPDAMRLIIQKCLGNRTSLP
jgi:DNA gyrase subunit B